VKFYRNHIGSSMDGSEGYRWFTSKEGACIDAHRHPREYTWGGAEIAKEFVLSPTRVAILELLNQVATHPDNG